MAIYKRGKSEGKGKVTYNAGIVKGIVVLAVSDVQGVALEKSNKDNLNLVKLNFNEDLVSIDVTVKVLYGYNVPDVAFNIQQSIKNSLESMSKYKVDSVDVHISGVVFSEEGHIWQSIYAVPSWYGNLQFFLGYEKKRERICL